MKTVPISMRLEVKLKARLEKEAKRRNQTASFIANRAIRLYFEELDQTRKELNEAFAEGEKGVFVSGEAIERWMASWDSDHELPPPSPKILDHDNTN